MDAPQPAPTAAPAPSTPPRRAARWLYHPIIPALIGALCYANTLGNGFAYDDERIVRDNLRIRELWNVRSIWLSEWWHDAAEPGAGVDTDRDRLYRPLTTQTFALNYALHGTNPFGFHLVNLLLHAACSGLVLSAGRRLLRDGAPAMLAALLFAVHPVHVEAVAQIVGRAEILAALFLLIGLVTLLPEHGRVGSNRTLFAAGSFLLAVLAKESAVCFLPVALLALHGTGPRRSLLWWLSTVMLLAAPLAMYFPLRYAALDGHLFGVTMPTPPVLNPLLDALPPGRIAGAFTVLGHYTRLIFLPIELSVDYGMGVISVEGLIQPVTLLGLATAVALVVPLRGFLRRPSAPGPVALLAAMTLASYALISNTFMLIGVPVAERLAYWPSAPALLLISLLGVRAWRRWTAEDSPLAPAAPAFYVIVGLLIAGLAARTVVRNTDWVNSLTLFGRQARAGTPSVQVNLGYARLLMAETRKMTDGFEKAGRIRETEQYVQRAQEHIQAFWAAPRRTSPRPPG